MATSSAVARVTRGIRDLRQGGQQQQQLVQQQQLATGNSSGSACPAAGGGPEQPAHSPKRLRTANGFLPGSVEQQGKSVQVGAADLQLQQPHLQQAALRGVGGVLAGLYGQLGAPPSPSYQISSLSLNGEVGELSTTGALAGAGGVAAGEYQRQYRSPNRQPHAAEQQQQQGLRGGESGVRRQGWGGQAGQQAGQQGRAGTQASDEDDWQLDRYHQAKGGVVCVLAGDSGLVGGRGLAGSPAAAGFGRGGGAAAGVQLRMGPRGDAGGAAGAASAAAGGGCGDGGAEVAAAVQAGDPRWPSGDRNVMRGHGLAGFYAVNGGAAGGVGFMGNNAAAGGISSCTHQSAAGVSAQQEGATGGSGGAAGAAAPAAAVQLGLQAVPEFVLETGTAVVMELMGVDEGTRLSLKQLQLRGSGGFGCVHDMERLTVEVSATAAAPAARLKPPASAASAPVLGLSQRLQPSAPLSPSVAAAERRLSFPKKLALKLPLQWREVRQKYRFMDEAEEQRLKREHEDSQQQNMKHEAEVMKACAGSMYCLKFYGVGEVKIPSGAKSLGLLMESSCYASLYDWMAARGMVKLPYKQAQHVMQDVTHGISHMHRKGFLHGDLKEENILVFDRPPSLPPREPSLIYVVTDFGGADKVSEVYGLGTTTAQTVQFSAPEQRDNSRQDRRLDSWQLGGLLMMLRSGHFPFALTPGEMKDWSVVYKKGTEYYKMLDTDEKCFIRWTLVGNVAARAPAAELLEGNYLNF